MSWLEVLTQLELDVAAYERLALDPDAPLPPAWAPTAVTGGPPEELRDRLTAALARLRDAEQALLASRATKAGELAALARPTDAAAVARYLDTTA